MVPMVERLWVLEAICFSSCVQWPRKPPCKYWLRLIKWANPEVFHTPSRILLGKLRMKVWKNCDMICFWKMAQFQDQSETNSYLPYILLIVSGSPSSFSSGICCNKCRNPTSMEKSSGLCSISGNIFLFTSKVDVGTGHGQNMTS